MSERLEGMPRTMCRPRFHFDKDDAVLIASDEIYLTPLATPVATKNDVAFSTQKTGSEFFSDPAQRQSVVFRDGARLFLIHANLRGHYLGFRKPPATDSDELWIITIDNTCADFCF